MNIPIRHENLGNFNILLSLFLFLFPFSMTLRLLIIGISNSSDGYYTRAAFVCNIINLKIKNILIFSLINMFIEYCLSLYFHSLLFDSSQMHCALVDVDEKLQNRTKTSYFMNIPIMLPYHLYHFQSPPEQQQSRDLYRFWFIFITYS